MAADGSRDVRKAKKTVRKAIRGAKGGGAESRTPIEAPDSLVSIAQARILDLISEGEIFGFVHGPGQGSLRDIFLDETPITNADGSFNFKNVVVETRLGTIDQNSMAGFPSVENEIGIAVELTAASDFVRTVNNLQLDAIRILMSVNALSKQDTSTGDITGYRVAYAIDLKVDAGAYVTVISGAFDGKASEKYQRSHRINLPPATTNWTFRIRRLTPDDASATIADTTMVDSYTEIIDAKFRYPMSAICGTVVDASQFRSIPTRSFYIKGRIIQVPVNYNPLTRVYTGTWDGTFKYAWTNNPAWIYYDMLTNARYGLGHIVAASQIDKWSLYNIGVYCDGYVPTGDLRRANATTGSATISASSTDNSYNMTTGSFLTMGFAAGDEVITSGFTNAANNGRGVIASVTALKMILTNEDALVTEAAAAARTIAITDPTEPRFTASIYFQRQEQAYKVIQDLASIFRGISFWAGGAIVPVCDKPNSPVYVYNNSNVVGGKFTYQGSGRRARHTVALVSWSDPNDFGRTKVEYVADDVGIARYGIQTTQVSAIGSSSQGAARRLGKWILLSERLLTDTCSWDVGLDGTLAAPGQVIRVADAKRAGKRIGGRVSAATLTTVTVDKMPTPTPAINDTIIVTTPAGTTLDRTITAVDVPNRKFTFATLGAGNIPVVGSMWATESATLFTQLFRIVSVSENKTNDSLTFSLTGMEYDPSIYDAVDFNTLIDKRPITGLAPNVQLPPTGLSLTATPRAGSVIASTFLTASWQKVTGAVAYELQWKGNNGNWSAPQRVTGLSTQYDQTFSGNWQFRIVSIGANRKRSIPVYSSVLAVLDQTMQPTSVSGAAASAAAAQTAANAANAEIANMTSDNILSIVEKKRLIADYNDLVNDQAGIDAEATNLGIGSPEKTNYDAAITALIAYMATIPTWTNLSVATTIVGATLRAKFSDAYAKRQVLLNKMVNKEKTLADTAQTAANAAQTTANSATADIANMASDNYLSVVEKKRIINDWNVIYNEKASIDSQAAIYSIGAELTSYDSAWTTLQSYLAGLSPAYNNLTVGTVVVGGTLRSNFANLYQARQVLLQKIADVVMYGADYTASENLLPNPMFQSNKIGAPTNLTIAIGSALRDGWIVNAAVGSADAQIYWDGTGVRVNVYGTTSIANGGFRATSAVTGKIYVQPNKTYEFGFDLTAVSFNGTPPAGVSYLTQLTCRWYNAAGTSISYVAGCTGTRTTGSSYGTLVAPATASYCVVEVRALIQNLSGAAWDITVGGGTVGINSRFNSVFMRKLDDLGVAGSGYQLGDQANSLMVRTGSTGSRWSGAAITYSIPTTGAPAVVTINVASGTLQCGSKPVTYSASSANVSQTRSTTVTYYLYYSDQKFTGGALTLNITTNAANLSNSDDRVWIGTVTVTTPVLGTGGSGSGGPEGGCVDGAMWIDADTQAEEICTTDLIDIVDERAPDGKLRMARRRVGKNVVSIAPCWRIKTERGAELKAAETTPFTLRDGSSKLIPDMIGAEVITNCYGVLRWEVVKECEFIGNRPVAHISVDNGSYFAGTDPNYRIASHNALKP